MHPGPEPYVATANTGYFVSHLIQIEMASFRGQIEEPVNPGGGFPWIDTFFQVGRRADQGTREDRLSKGLRGTEGVGADLQDVIVEHDPTGHVPGLDVKNLELAVVAPDLVDRALDMNFPARRVVGCRGKYQVY
jgi:hypothetical protein